MAQKIPPGLHCHKTLPPVQIATYGLPKNLARVFDKNTVDTVGQPPNTHNHASYLPALKAQKSLESNAVTAAVSHGNRMTNSIHRDFERL
jgi:hypothetical protein